MALLPQRLTQGDTIGIVSPARWMDAEQIKAATSVLEDKGYKVKISVQNLERYYQFAGHDTARAIAINEAFADPGVKAIMCTRGGYGCLRIVDLLDYDLIRRNPKAFIGYSDVTALLLSITKHTGLITFHGPMLYSFMEPLDQLTIGSFVNVLTNATPVPLTLSSQIRVIREGSGVGKLIGGNLSILVNVLGTSTDSDWAGSILFLEDVDEYLYHLDRMLWHLKRSGKLEKLSGLIVGEMKNTKDNAIPFGIETDDMIREVCKNTSFPIVSNFPCGHGTSLITFPLFATAELKCDGHGAHIAIVDQVTI